jgi:peptidoglycan-associated lipoprotein
MKSRVLLALGAVGMLGLLTGCPPSYPNCDTTEDCVVDGQQAGVCVNGTCQECGSDADCKAGFSCDTSTPGANRCVPIAGYCTSKTDCPEDQACVNNRCGACQGDAQCGSGFECVGGACRSLACQSDEDCTGGRQCVDGFCTTPEVVRCEPSGPVRFPFDQASLTSEAQSNLQALADCLQSNQYAGASVVIEGHADERGTDQYNMLLSQRRADAVKRYLSSLGVEDNRLRTVGYGEERPLVDESNESAWEQNRRAEFNVTR